METEERKCSCLALVLLAGRGLAPTLLLIPVTHQPGDSHLLPATAPWTMLICPWPAEELSLNGEVEEVTELQ